MSCIMAYPDAIEAINKRVKEKNVPREDLAKAAEVSKSYLSRLLSLKRTASDQVLMNLAQAVKLDPLEILRVANRIPREPSDNDELDKQIMYLVKLLPVSEKEKIAKRLELETQIYEQQQPAKSANKTRA